jgi:hypothetical protein
MRIHRFDRSWVIGTLSGSEAPVSQCHDRIGTPAPLLCGLMKQDIDGFLQKPYSMIELARVLSALLKA